VRIVASIVALPEKTGVTLNVLKSFAHGFIRLRASASDDLVQLGDARTVAREHHP
jgi:hypothetical protein